MPLSVPPLACDSHMHVFGPLERYPGAPGRTYTPSAKRLEEYHRVANRLGLQRTVLVQPSAFGNDNRAMLDTQGRGHLSLRGVDMIDESCGPAALHRMHQAGVRGVRLNLLMPRITDIKAACPILECAAAQVAPLDWHVQIHCDGEILFVIAPLLADLPVPVVFEHMGGVRSFDGLENVSFRALCNLLARGQCWAKFSGADIATGNDSDLGGATPYARTLVAGNVSRLVWGSDRPHLTHQHAGIGEAAPPEVLRASVTDESGWPTILVDTPAQLYGF
jgi:predicted TIM-barrel fold metal-dependent hydrolase